MKRQEQEQDRTTTPAPKPQPRRKPAGPERLKPERIELRLKTLPGWTLRASGRTISRFYALPDTTRALAFLGAMQNLGRLHGRLPRIHLRADGALVSLPTQRSGSIESADYDLALALGK
jgi:pterin-4a-carbinolamine dehydratase